MISLVCNNETGDKLRQYDLNRRIVVYAKNTVEEIWFRKGGLKLAVPFIKDGEGVIAEVPNIMLKEFGVMTAEAISIAEDGVTHNEKQNFYVHKRDMPAGYIYTETETIGVLNNDGGGQSDLNAAEGEPGHVKNRTHYSEFVEKVRLDETTVELNDENGGQILLDGSFEVGDTYTVKWNGVEYSGTIVYMGGFAAGGNLKYFDDTLTEEYTEPFGIVSADGMCVMMSFEALPLAVTVSVKVVGETVQRLPAKFAPSYIITDVDGTAINESFDNFADVLWNGGTVCVRTKTENGYTAYNVVGWGYGYSEETGGAFTLCGYNFGVSMGFTATNGTWTPPT